jgi:hypothetical protein
MRDRFIRFRLSDSERQALDNMLTQEDRKPGEFLRELVRAEARRRGLWPLQVQVKSPANTQREAVKIPS